jgi:tripartite-type tricarboxylate transporter receptor subunit TctC
VAEVLRAVHSSFTLDAAPAGAPAPVINALAEATRKVMADPALQAELAKLAIQPTTDSSPTGAVAYIQSETLKWKPVVDATGIRSE